MSTQVWFRSIVVTGIMSALGMTVSAHAAPITFAFEGNLSEVDAPLASTWSLGQAFSGTYTFDSNAGDSGAPGVGDYLRAPQDFQATIGTVGLVAGIPAPIGGLGSIHVYDGNFPPGADSYRVSIVTAGPSVSEFSPASFRLGLIDSTGSALISTNLPTSPPILSAFQEQTATFTFFRQVNGEISFASAVGQLTGLTPVPLPAAAVFFGTGLLGLAGHLGVKRWPRSRHSHTLHKHA
jgi:hypothetical protein